MVIEGDNLRELYDVLAMLFRHDAAKPSGVPQNGQPRAPGKRRSKPASPKSKTNPRRRGKGLGLPDSWVAPLSPKASEVAEKVRRKFAALREEGRMGKDARLPDSKKGRR
jgi:hypothetical protein